MNNSEEDNPWHIQHSESKYQNPWIELTEHQVLNPSGNPGIYGVVHFKNLALGILAVEPDLNIWLVGQYRFPLNEYSWEIPEGGGALDLPPLESAKRELEEETGLTAQKWEHILTMHLSNSVSDEKAYIWIATDLKSGTASPEETELLKIKKIPLTQAFDEVKAGKITDSMTVAAILILQLKVLDGWRPKK